jgi:hypothetical protein
MAKPGSTPAEMVTCRSSAVRSICCGPTPARTSATSASGTMAGCPVRGSTRVLRTTIPDTSAAEARSESG